MSIPLIELTANITTSQQSKYFFSRRIFLNSEYCVPFLLQLLMFVMNAIVEF